MQTALSESVRSPFQCLTAWVAVAHRLASEADVLIKYVPMPADRLGDWDGATRTLYVRADAPIDKQVWLLQELWRYLAIGPHASPSAQPLPMMQLVPAPRSEAAHERTA